MICLFAGFIFAIVLFFAATYYCYRTAFSVPKKYRKTPNIIPEGDQYSSQQKEMNDLIRTAVAIPFEPVSTTSEDGLTLFGRYYETAPGAPVEILFHGYRGHALRDFSGGMQLGLACGCNVLLVDQRAHGQSEGRCLSFGILERHDCLSWIGYAIDRFGKDTRIILTGISMGAATVMMASDLPLPDNVVGIIADCGYTSPRAIIQKVIACDTHYPKRAAYALVRLGGRIFGGFDIESHSATDALRHTRIPILMIHGEDDHFVPCDMSRENFAACASQKELLTVPGAGHGISFLVDYTAYRTAVRDFMARVGLPLPPDSK